jgi:hypothetical protein
MRWIAPLALASLGAAAALSPAPARAGFGVGVGIGTRIPGTGIHTGIGYSRGRRWEHVGVGVYVDAGYYAERERRRRERERGGRRGERPSEEISGRAEENVSLRVSPANCWVFLNGALVEAYGDDRLSLPPGRYRFEFARRGRRTEAVEVEVAPGSRHVVERRLALLEPGEPEDSRLARDAYPIPVDSALRNARVPPAWREGGEERR